MPSTSQSSAMNQYGRAMTEIGERMDAIDILLFNKTLPTQVVAESVFLQLRLCCELIAIGSLIAHGDIEGINTSDLRKESHAERILKAVELLHSDFFPIPYERVPCKGGYMIKEPTYRTLTRDEFKDLYIRCGQVLHRGPVKHYGPLKQEPTALLLEGQDAAQRMVGLLRYHHIKMLKENAWLACVHRTIEREGRSQVAWVAGVEPTPPAESPPTGQSDSPPASGAALPIEEAPPPRPAGE